MKPCLLAFALVAACYSKPDVPSRPDCDAGECSSSSGAQESSSEAGDESNVTVVTSDPTTSLTTNATTSADESTSDTPSSESSSDDESSSTGAPVDNLYAPCTSDDACTSGRCVHGFCSQICWSMAEGETPCPPPPDGSVGVTIICGTIGFASGFDHFCEGCQDCAQYCIASCGVDVSTCPNGGYCVGDSCAPQPDYAYCGSDIYEYDDAACSDGLDNDADGSTDCDDVDCSSTPTVTVCA